jgi:tetratricopeptide (TPR) repeat protein
LILSSPHKTGKTAIANLIKEDADRYEFNFSEGTNGQKDLEYLIDRANEKILERKYVVETRPYDIAAYFLGLCEEEQKPKKLQHNLANRINRMKNLPKMIHNTKIEDLLLSEDDGKVLLRNIVDNLGVAVEQEDVLDLLLKIGRLGPVEFHERLGGKTYYFPEEMEKELNELISKGSRREIEESKVDALRNRVKKMERAEKEFLSEPSLIPFVTLISMQGPLSSVVQSIVRDFITNLPEYLDKITPVLNAVIPAVPMFGIAFLFMVFVKKREKKTSRQILDIAEMWADIPETKRKAIGEIYDSMLGLSRGRTEKTFDSISGIAVNRLRTELLSRLDQLEERVAEVEMNGLKEIKSSDDLREKLPSLTDKDSLIIGTESSNEDIFVRSNVEKIIEGLHEKSVYCITGEPGSGKTILLYLTGMSLLKKENKIAYITDISVANLELASSKGFYLLLDLSRSDIAKEFRGRMSGITIPSFLRIIVAGRSDYLECGELPESYEMNLSYNHDLLKKMAIRRIEQLGERIPEGKGEEIAEKLAERSEGLPYYIKEAVKVLEKEGYDESILKKMPEGVAGLVRSILEKELRTNSRLLIVYYLLSHTAGLPEEYLYAIDSVYGSGIPSFIDVGLGGTVSLHSWYRDIIEAVDRNDLSNIYGVENLPEELVDRARTVRDTGLAGYLKEISDTFLRGDNSQSSKLKTALLEADKHQNGMHIEDIADLLMLCSTVWLAEKKLKNKKSGYGFNILMETVSYNSLDTQSSVFFNRLVGFLVNGYIPNSGYSESEGTRPFYCLSVFYTARLLQDSFLEKVAEAFINGKIQGPFRIHDFAKNYESFSYPLRVYATAMIRILEKLEYISVSDDYEKGLLHYCKGGFHEAILEFDRAIELNPLNPGYHNNKGNALYEIGRHEEAIEEFNKAKELRHN